MRIARISLSSVVSPAGYPWRWFTGMAILIMIVITLAATPAQAAGKSAIHPKAKGGLPMAMTLASPVFTHNGEIPKKYTCDSLDISPPLKWSGIPDGTRSLVLIVDDPDAPDPAAPKMTWVHWVLYNIPPSVDGLGEGVKQLPSDTLEGLNDWRRTGYGGPCPPIGRHRYFHKLYALDDVLPDLGDPTKAKLEQAMQGHILEHVELIGTYQH
jgi:Raf kinase inhibitor-like YbhB/YbcL family protein